MGNYLQTPGTTQGKAEYLMTHHRAIPFHFANALSFFQAPGTSGLVCVVENPTFDAALYCKTHADFLRTIPRGDDTRPRTYLLMDVSEIQRLLGQWNGQ